MANIYPYTCLIHVGNFSTMVTSNFNESVHVLQLRSFSVLVPPFCCCLLHFPWPSLGPQPILMIMFLLFLTVCKAWIFVFRVSYFMSSNAPWVRSRGSHWFSHGYNSWNASSAMNPFVIKHPAFLYLAKNIISMWCKWPNHQRGMSNALHSSRQRLDSYPTTAAAHEHPWPCQDICYRYPLFFFGVWERTWCLCKLSFHLAFLLYVLFDN